MAFRSTPARDALNLLRRNIAIRTYHVHKLLYIAGFVLGKKCRDYYVSS